MIKKVKGNRRRLHRNTWIDEDTLPVNLWYVLKLAGYKYRLNIKDWIKIDKEGRFHIKEIEGLHSLHYDIYGEECDHYSIPMPFKCSKEKRRIVSIAKSLSIKKEKDSITNSLMKTYQEQ